jgi:beta-galactosidase
MRFLIRCFTIVTLTAALFTGTEMLQAERQVLDLESGWLFHHGDPDGAQRVDFDDSAWQPVQVPHDWAFEGGVSEDGAQEDRGGYYGAGIGWYRYSFDASDDFESKRTRIEFDGVYMNSEVWINGEYLGKRPYGYISFAYELTPYLREGENTIAVRVDNSLEPSARWYHPCGIYAPVRLVATESQRVARHGTYITTPEVAEDEATVRIETMVENKGDDDASVYLETVLLDPEGREAGRDRRSVRLGGRGEEIVVREIRVGEPRRWDLDTPELYTAVSRVSRNGTVVDEVETRFGIRTIEWDTETGFWLNERNTKLLGVCEHWHGGPVGGAWTRGLMRWKLGLLKEMGVNAIRTAHNPAPPFFYELCDEMGILVMDEIFDGWMRKAPHDYGAQAFDEWWERDLTEWMTRNRNHPSIVIYSVGNETRGPVAPKLVEACHAIDPTRPVTSGHSGSEYMDVYGVNGHSERMSFFTEDRPDKPFVATEAPHTWQTRGFYRTQTWYRDGYPSSRQDPFEIPDLTEEEIFHYDWAGPEDRTNHKQHFNSSYDNATVRITARQNWELMRDLPWFSGHFRWTGFDYYGEAGYVHGGWPFRLFMGGPIDVAGFPKDLFYFYQSQWTEEPMVHILPHWTHPTMAEGTEIPVWVYSNGDEVELFINGRSLGRQSPGNRWDEMQCEWLVPWEPGTVEAIAYRNGEEVARTRHVTAESPQRLDVEVETGEFAANGRDPAILTVATADAEGNFYPFGENRVYFHFEGPVRLRSLENGDPVDTDPHVGIDSRRAFMGKTRAFLQSTEDNGPAGAVVGAILGERRQLTSNLVAIDVRTAAIRGEAPKGTFEVRYTTDGSIPTEDSSLYQGPFAVDLGTMVRALVRLDGESLFLMEERFAEDAGLFWGDSETDWQKVPDTGMQAEFAEFEGAEVDIVGRDYYGTGYVDFRGEEGWIRWYQENDGGPGDFYMRFRYAINDQQRGGRSMDLYINGRNVDVLEFENTGHWNREWRTLDTVQELASGANIIELRTRGHSGPNLDELRIRD